MSDQIQPRNSSFRKRPNFNNNNENKIQFLPSYTPDEKYKYENFEIQKDKKIGSGFLSKVYLSTNKIDNLNYAVKIIKKKKVLKNGLSLDIIKNEIEIQERIIHPNIVRMYSHYEDENNYYCFLEYINGPSLLNIMEQKKNGLSERETCKYFLQILESIKFLHSNKIIHRDIKLENFLIENNTIIKLIDFGCCVLLTEDEPKRLSICGTHLYMSPELINSQPYDYCVDIWALGVLFFELLHGYSPFGKRDDNYNIIYGNILINKIKFNKELTNNCLDLLSKMLENDCEKRIDIFGILNHPWIKDWSFNNENSSIINSNFSGNDSQIISKEDDNNYFDNLMNKVEFINKKGGKSKKKKKSIAEGAKYEKRKVFHSHNKNHLHHNNDSNVSEEKKITKSKKVNSLINLNDIIGKNNEEIKKKEKKIENKIEPTNIETLKLEEKKIEQPKIEEIKPLKIKKDPIIKQQINNNNNKNNNYNNNNNNNNNNYNNNNNNNSNNNNINSFRSGGKKDNIDFKVNEIIKNDSNDEYTTENILNMLDNSKNKSNNKSNSSNSDEINTDYSHILRKKEKEIQRTNNSHNDNNIFRNNQSFRIVTRMSQNEGNDLKSTLQMFAKAEKLKQENEKIKLKTKEKSFWDKLFAPFKCGDD